MTFGTRSGCVFTCSRTCSRCVSTYSISISSYLARLMLPMGKWRAKEINSPERTWAGAGTCGRTFGPARESRPMARNRASSAFAHVRVSQGRYRVKKEHPQTGPDR